MKERKQRGKRKKRGPPTHRERKGNGETGTAGKNTNIEGEGEWRAAKTAEQAPRGEWAPVPTSHKRGEARRLIRKDESACRERREQGSITNQMKNRKGRKRGTRGRKPDSKGGGERAPPGRGTSTRGRWGRKVESGQMPTGREKMNARRSVPT